MKKMLAFLLLAFALPAFAPAEPTRWQQVALFDWVYPGETAYADLKQAAIQAQAQGWVVERIRSGERLPQASARDLAWQLQKNAAVDPDLKARLKAQFADEADLLGGGQGDGVSGKRTGDLTHSLDIATDRMDALEATIKANHYGKGSTPALNLDLYTGYRLDAPAGLRDPSTGRTILDHRAYLLGGMNATFLGTLDKINFAVGIGAEYVSNDGATLLDYERRNGITSIGASFQLPLGNGGLDVSLGELSDLNLSPLLLSGILPVNRDGFFVDITGAYRPPKVIKTMELGYPAGTRGLRGLLIRRQGASIWWPFTKTYIVYAPSSQDYWEVWEQRLNTYMARLEEDLGPRGSWLDGLLIYGLVGGSFNDADLQTVGSTLSRLPQSTFNTSLGTELRFSNGTSLKFDAATSSYTKIAPAYTLEQSGLAWLGTLVQPVGPLFFAFEAAAADPTFISKPTLRDRLQSGATFDSAASIVDDGDAFMWAPAVGSTPRPPAYITLMKDPTILTNNSQRYTLKSEWHSSFISLGLYEGVISQITATGPYVMTSPIIQGRSDNGYGMFKIFGQSYDNPPSVGSAGSPSLGGRYYQGAYNLPTDGTGAKGNQAEYAPAAYNQLTGVTTPAKTKPVHWQQMTQWSYREAQYTVLLSKDGKADVRILPDSIKVLNYAGANVGLDFGSLFGMTLPFEMNVVGEVRDLANQASVPSLDDSGLFNQQIVSAFLTYGLTETLNLVGMAAYETWKTKQSFYPVNIQIQEYGIGSDLNLDPVVTGLKLNFRASSMKHEDLNIGSREFTLLTVSVGSTLTY